MVDKHKLDIFDVLKRITSKNVKFSTEELKVFAPVVITRWLSGTNSERQIYILNMYANRYCFSLSNHKELLINLMSVSTAGRFTKYKWIKRSTKSKNIKMVHAVVAEYYRYPLRHAKNMSNMLDDATILSHADDLGYQPDQIKVLKKELKIR